MNITLILSKILVPNIVEKNILYVKNKSYKEAVLYSSFTGFAEALTAWLRLVLHSKSERLLSAWRRLLAAGVSSLGGGRVELLRKYFVSVQSYVLLLQDSFSFPPNCPVILGFFSSEISCFLGFWSSEMSCLSRILVLQNFLLFQDSGPPKMSFLFWILAHQNVLLFQDSGPPKCPIILGFWFSKMSFLSWILVLQNVLFFRIFVLQNVLFFRILVPQNVLFYLEFWSSEMSYFFRILALQKSVLIPTEVQQCI